MELFDEKEKARIKFQQVQVEKNYFLGEFKENVILAVKKQELDGKMLREVAAAMKREDAVLLKISRNIPLKKEYKNTARQIFLLSRNFIVSELFTFTGPISR